MLHAGAERSHLSRRMAARPVTSDPDVDAAVEDLNQSKQLIDGFLVICLVEGAVKLGRGGFQPADDLAFR